MRHIHSAFTFSRPSTPLLLVPLLAGMLLLATGCTSTHRVTESSSGQEAGRSEAYGYSQVTEDVSGETVRVSLRNGQWMELENLYVGPDSTTGVGPTGGEKAFPTSYLQKIKLIDREAGFWQGAGIGIAIPLGLGVLGSAMEEDEFIPAWIIGAALSIPAGLLGGLIGVARGQRDVYRFPEHSPEMDSTATSTRDEIETVQRREK